MSKNLKLTSVSVTYRGVEEELGRILEPFFIAVVWLFFCIFVAVVAGSGIGGTCSAWGGLLTVPVAAAVNVGALGIEGTGSWVVLSVISAAVVNVGALEIGERVLLTVAVAAIFKIGALRILGTCSRVLLTVAVTAPIVVNVGVIGLLVLVIAAATVGETGGSRSAWGTGVAGFGIAREAVGSEVNVGEELENGEGFSTLVILRLNIALNGQAAMILLRTKHFKDTIWVITYLSSLSNHESMIINTGTWD